MNAYEKATARRKLPTKYTKKGLTDVAKLLSGNIFMKHKVLTDYKKEKESGEREYIEGYTDYCDRDFEGRTKICRECK